MCYLPKEEERINLLQIHPYPLISRNVTQTHKSGGHPICSNTTSVSSNHISVASGFVHPMKRMPLFFKKRSMSSFDARVEMCSWQLEVLPRSKCLGLTTLPCSHPCLWAGGHIVSPYSWITKTRGIPEGGLMYCPIVVGMVNCPIGSDWTGTRNCSVAYFFATSNCPTGVTSNCGGSKDGTLSYSEVADEISSIDLFSI